MQGRAHPGLSYSNAVGGGGYEAAGNGSSINPTPVSGSSPYASASSNGGPANGGSAYSSGRCAVPVFIVMRLCRSVGQGCVGVLEPYASASSNGGPANGGSAYSSGRCGELVTVLSYLQGG